MALNKDKGNTKSFEDDESGLEEGGAAVVEERKPSADERVAAAAAAKAKTAEKAADKSVESGSADEAKPSASREVAAPAAGSLAVRMSAADPFKKLENAIRVDYNTLDRIMVSNGNVMNKETDELMGESCVLELISIQKQWVMSPGGDKKDDASLEFLKYSDDGIHVKDTGDTELLATYKDLAIAAGYEEARIVERLILVGEMVDAGKLASKMNGTLVQIDLAPRSKANFEKHRISTAYRVGKGLLPAEGAERVQINAAVQSKGSNKWTDALFSSPT